MADPLIVVEDVVYSFAGQTEVLRDLTLTVAAGEFAAIVGANGSGKSTLLKLLIGLLTPRRGAVLVDGLDTRTTTVADLAQLAGLVFQNAADQLVTDRVEDEIAFGPRRLGLTEAEVTARVDEALTWCGLGDRRAAAPHTLAHGERRWLCLAAIVAMRPSILLLDEPTGGLDHRATDRMLDLVHDQHRQGVTILLATRYLAQVAAHAERVIVLAAGQVEADGPPRAVLADAPLLARCRLAPPPVARLSLALADLGVPVALTPEELLASLRGWAPPPDQRP